MTKATLSPRIPDSGQRNAFVSPNSDCFSALRHSVSTLPLGKDDSGPKFPAVIFDSENPRAACRNHCLIQQDKSEFCGDPAISCTAKTANSRSSGQKFSESSIASTPVSSLRSAITSYLLLKSFFARLTPFLILFCKSQRSSCCFISTDFGRDTPFGRTRICNHSE
jgi:hypothetical protein